MGRKFSEGFRKIESLPFFVFSGPSKIPQTQIYNSISKTMDKQTLFNHSALSTSGKNTCIAMEGLYVKNDGKGEYSYIVISITGYFSTL